MKQIAGFLITAFLLFTLDGFAISQEQWNEVENNKMRAKVISMGREKVVEAQLKDKTVIKGYIVQANDQDFVICNYSGNIVVSYADLKKIKRVGISNQGKIWLGIGIGVGAAIACLSLLLQGLD